MATRKLHIAKDFALPLDVAGEAIGILATRGAGKRLALDTPLPTPNGWTSMEDISPGDLVFDELGEPCRVDWIGPVEVGNAYRVVFSDGSSIVADDEHLWLTSDKSARWNESRRLVVAGGSRAERPQCQRQPQTFPQVRTTAEIRTTLHRGKEGERNHAIRNALPLDLPEALLPVDPYVLGVWLGDGTRGAGAVTCADIEIIDEIRAAGYVVERWESTRYAWVARGLRKQLRELGVLREKRIPPLYLRASASQRLALLQGLMDTDGGWSTSQAEIALSDEELADDVYELIVSLGMRASRSSRIPQVDGKPGRRSYRTSFSPITQVFRLPRKASRFRDDTQQQLRRVRRYIVAVEKTADVPMRCISVSSPSRLYLAGRQMVPTHNSFTSAALIEELFDAGVQVVVLDPTGVYWGLRGYGEQEGLPLYVFGGSHGDLPLESTAGELLADLAVDEPHSFVLDLSSFDSKGQQTRFVRSFAERLYRRKNDNRETLHLILDESDEFCPQKPMGRDELPMLGAMETIVRRGRSRGLGVTMITQRSAAINKNVLALCETLIVMRTPAPQDRKAVSDWISHHHLADELGVLDSMPSLRTGTAWIWSPVRDILKQVEIRHIRTFDSYRTPKVGEAQKEPRKMAKIDLEEIARRMQATVERAKASDPRELQLKIKALQDQLRTRPTEQLIERVTVEVPVLGPSDIAELETVVAEMREIASEIVEPIIVKADELMLALHERKMTDMRIRREAAGLSGTKKKVEAEAEKKREPGPEANGFDPSNAQQKVLDAIAWLEDTGLAADRLRVGWLCGYTQSGHFHNLLSSLKTAGAITYPSPGFVSLTKMGAALSQPPAPALGQDAIQERVMSILVPAQQRVLRVVMNSYPDDIARTEVASQLDYSESGHFNNLISKLTTLGMITRSRGGYVRAADLLFVS